MEAGPSSAQATLAHYWDDVTDTLTGDQNPAIPPTEGEPTTSVVNTVLIGAATIVMIFWLGHWLSAWRRTRRAKRFNLELRRRHGIPDSDTRPFSVAYQAASIAARDSMRKSQSTQPENPPFIGDTAPSTGNIKEGFRPQGRSRPPIPHFPGQPPVRIPSGSFSSRQAQLSHPSTSSLDSSRALSQLPNVATTGSWGPRYSAGNFRATSVPTVPTVSSRSAFAIAAASGSIRSNNGLALGIGSGDRRTWHANRPATMSRANGNAPQARPRKRLYLTADEEAEEQTGMPTDKRSRTAGWGSEAMIDGDNEPKWAQSYQVESKPVPDSSAPQIGKSKGKRPADDSEGDLRADGKRRQTKSSKQRPKLSDVQEKRGTKRGRKEVDTASVSSDVMPVHKRGRAGGVDNDLSIVKEEEVDDEEGVSRDPLCGGRRIGQKWASNGQEFMVGPNGDRLRLVNVKESRKKYYMPADSKHADNFHTVSVFVEKWFTEEQYAKAKADGLLAWQENENLPANIKQESPDRVPLESKENQAEEERLRAISTTAITLSRARTANTLWNMPGQSPSQTASPHTNPFNTPPSATTPQSPGPRRVRYSIGAIPPAALNSRMISAWEKQEKEANALKILRERRAAEAAAKATPAPPTAAIPAVPTLTLPSAPAPTITVTAPSPASTPKVPEPASSINKPTFNFALPTSKPAEPALTVPASTPTPATAPTNPFSSLAPKKDEAAKPLFSATPATTSTTPGFGTNTSTAPSTAPAATISPFGVTTAAPAFAPPPATATAPKPFTFPAPSTAPQPTAPTSTSPFGAAPASTPFGTTPAAAPFGATPAAPSPAATKPMGGFSFNSAPAAPAANSATAPTGSTLFGGQAAQPASTLFPFNTANVNAKPANTGFSLSAAPQATTQASTGFGNATAPNPNLFATPATTAGATSSGFGTGLGTNSSAGTGTSSSFNFSVPKPAATTPGFGALPTAPAPTTFKFGEMNSATPTAAAGNGPSIQFGAKPTVTIPANTPFGAPSTTTPTTATNVPFPFGAGTVAGVNGAVVSPATPSQPLFNLDPTASPAMAPRQISSSRRVQRAMSKPLH